MRILFARCFGLGNAVMSVPAIKAWATLGSVEVLIGSTPDDPGAFDVLHELQQFSGCIKHIHIDYVDEVHGTYDVAVLSIPFDDRWEQGVHFKATRALDGRPRPDFNPQLGFAAWKQHESLYQLDIAADAGYTGDVPSSRFIVDAPHAAGDPDTVYLGLGFKRAPTGHGWSVKHWGNDRYAEFMREVRRLHPSVKFITTGGNVDVPLIADLMGKAPLTFSSPGLRQSFRVLGAAGSYFGNDTGMMHVAASMGKPCYMMHVYRGSEVKNPPLTPRRVCEFFGNGAARDPLLVAADFVEFVWGDA